MTLCWVLSEGMIGTQNQCVALAEAAGLSYEIKVVKVKQPWKTVTPWIRHFSYAALAEGSSDFSAPWPDIVIASGRKAIAPGLWIKKQSGNNTKLVIIQSPVVKDKKFDLVIVSPHDRYEHPKAVPMTGALSIITPAKLAEARTEWQSRLEQLPGPRLAVMIGGNSNTHELTQEIAENLVRDLNILKSQYSLMITASRRTPEPQRLYMQQHVTGGNVLFWDGEGDNPYRGFLAWADALIVTEDSVSMACEAVSTAKPVYILPLGKGSKRFKRFHTMLIDNNYARWFMGKIDHWTYTPPDDLQRAADKVNKMLNRF